MHIRGDPGKCFSSGQDEALQSRCPPEHQMRALQGRRAVAVLCRHPNVVVWSSCFLLQEMELRRFAKRRRSDGSGEKGGLAPLCQNTMPETRLL